MTSVLILQTVINSSQQVDQNILKKWCTHSSFVYVIPKQTNHRTIIPYTLYTFDVQTLHPHSADINTIFEMGETL